jgi:hypothetical protein
MFNFTVVYNAYCNSGDITRGNVNVKEYLSQFKNVKSYYLTQETVDMN